MKKEKRDVLLKCYVSDREAERVRRAAKACGLPLSHYLRTVLKGESPKALPPAEFPEILSELRTIRRLLKENAADGAGAETAAQAAARLQHAVGKLMRELY